MNIYLFETVVYFLFLLFFQYYIVSLFATTTDAVPLLRKHRSGEPLTEEETLELLDILSSAPAYFRTAVWSQLWTFAIPIQILLKYIYTRYVTQPFRFLATYFLDLVYMSLYAYVLWKHLEMSAETNSGMGIDPNNADLVYIEAYNMHLSESEFNVQLVCGIMGLVGYLRFLTALRGTETLGPIISTIIYMLKDVSSFLVVWLLVILAFAQASVSMFQDVETLKSFDSSLFYWFECAFGGWDLSMYDAYLEKQPPSENLRRFGIVFNLLYVAIQLIVLVNMVIAIMTDTYTTMSTQRKGIYN